MKTCIYCGAEFLPRRVPSLWCSLQCERDHGEQHEQETLIDIEPTPRVVEPDWGKHP